MLIPIIDVWVLTDVTIKSSIAKKVQQIDGLFLKIYNQYSFSYKCWNFCANWLIWIVVIKENKRGFFSEHSVYWSCASVCLSVPHRHISTLLHGPGCNLGNGTGASCAILGGIAIGVQVSLLWQHSAKCEMSASACTRSMPCYVHCESKKGATLTMAITLSILGDFENSFTAAKSSKFPTKQY